MTRLLGKQVGQLTLDKFQATGYGLAPKVVSGSVVMSGDLVSVISTQDGIDATITGSHAFLSIPSGFSAIVYGLTIRCTSVTGFTSPASVSAGLTTSIDIMPVIGLSSVTAVNNSYDFQTAGKTLVIPTGSSVVFYISTAAVATSQTFSVDLIGYLF